MNAHPAAELFPLMSDDDLAALAADITANGQLEPIVVCQDLILDGRNRWLACQRADVTPRTVAYDGPLSPTAYVLSANLHRRHLSAGQKAMIAVAALPHFEAEAKQRQQAAGRQYGKGHPKLPENPQEANEQPSRRGDNEAAAQAAKAVGVNYGAVYAAKRIIRDAPDLAEEVKAGTKTLNRAHIETRQRRPSASKPEGGDATPSKPKRRPKPMSDAEFTEMADAVEQSTRAAFAYTTLERLGRCPYEPRQVAAAVPGNQRFRVDGYLKAACDWLEEFRRIWTADDNGPA